MKPVYVMTGAQRYRARRPPLSRWRRLCRSEIVSAIEVVAQHDTRAVLEAAEGCKERVMRKHAPEAAGRRTRVAATQARWLSEAWSKEITLLTADLGAVDKSHEEWAAIEVAGDLVELGRVAEAEQLLAEQAPHRHARGCPSCGAAPGKPCADLVPADGVPGYYMTRDPRLIPHAARCQP